MPSEKVAGALERLGVDVPAEDLAHYAVRLNKRKEVTCGISRSNGACLERVRWRRA